MPATMPNDTEVMANAQARLMAAAVADMEAEGLGGGPAVEETSEGKDGASAGAGETKTEASKTDGKALPQRGEKGRFVAGGSGGGPSAGERASKAAAAPSKSSTVPAKAEPGSSKPAPVEASTEESAVQEPNKLETLRALAKELGFAVDEARVSLAERTSFRKKMQGERQRIALIEPEATARAQAILQDANLKAGHILRAAEAWERGDPDAFAQALGRKDWNDLNTEAIGRYADPNFKRMRDLEKREAERAQREEQARKAAERAREEQAESRQITAYKTDLSAQMATSSDPLIAAFADDPSFIEAVFRVQKANFDGTNTVTPEEAVRLPPNEGGLALFEHMRQLYSRLEKAFRAGRAAAQQQTEHEPAQAGLAPQAAVKKPEPVAGTPADGSSRVASVPVRQSKPSTSIPQRKATEAAAPAKFTNDRDFLKYGEQLMLEAIARDNP